MTIESAYFAVQRYGDALFKCKGSELKDKLQNGDVMPVQRAGVISKWDSTQSNLDKIQDGDLFACTDTDGVTKKVTGAQFKELFEEPKPPWETHEAGVWHIVKPSRRLNLTGGPYYAYYTNGTFRGKITSVETGEEIVFLGNRSAAELFKNNQLVLWKFGELTNTSHVSNMYNMFYKAQSCKLEEVGSFDVSNVTNMKNMFQNCFVMNTDLSSWDVVYCKNFSHMFDNCKVFNGDITTWNPKNASDFSYFLYGAKEFNQPIGNWDVSRVTNAYSMFNNCWEFNQELNDWKFPWIDNMASMFSEAQSFNQPLDKWDMSNVLNVVNMFHSAKSFNQDISTWNTSGIMNMVNMFKNGRDFNQDLSQWCVSQFSSAPLGWDIASLNGYTEPKPQWGKCPRGEDQA